MATDREEAAKPATAWHGMTVASIVVAVLAIVSVMMLAGIQGGFVGIN